MRPGLPHLRHRILLNIFTSGEFYRHSQRIADQSAPQTAQDPLFP